MKNYLKLILLILLFAVLPVLYMPFILHGIANGNYTFMYLGLSALFIFALTIYFLGIKENKEKQEELLDKIDDKLKLEFNKKEFDDEDKEAQAREDLEAFVAYDTAIENNLDECSEYDISIDYPIIEYEYNIKSKKRLIDLCKYYYHSVKTTGSHFVNYINTEIIVAFETVNVNKRLHIMTNHNYKDENFDECFIDFKDKVLEFDKNNLENYSEVFNRQYHRKKDINCLNYEYINLTSNEKKFLINLYKETKLEFSFAIERGVGRIRISFINNIDNLQTISTDEEIINKVIKIIKELISKTNSL